ncbi:hypothetical protein EDD18DRAFT_1432348 [Armillaria luteobubalina]|uniref:F-box domain-containing protein n=1 Tax=Armillaria luteobubalina TaxID=153913 RepID=A0AA39UXH4_9AGAR|nr:hypothetical protein EDD18DRAFT_1432348 [Armillaria luteobubalina]
MSVEEPNHPYLPLDILQEIFEYAARVDRQVALNLVQVSSWAREWIDPILYHVVSLRRESTIRNFLRTIDTAKSQRFFLDHSNRQNTSRLCRCNPSNHILRADLANPDTLPSELSLTRTTWDSCLESTTDSLSVLFPTILHGFYPQLNLPFYSRLTHLSIINDSTDWTAWTGFHSLSNLTHLALDVRAEPQPIDPDKAARICSTVAFILGHCPSLRVCVLLLLFTPDPPSD